MYGQPTPGQPTPGFGGQFYGMPSPNPGGAYGMQMPGVNNYTPGGQPTIKVRPVASYDEAKAIPTDFMGGVTMMPDFSHGIVYAKALNPQNNTPIFKMFREVEMEQPQPAPVAPSEPAPPQYDPKPDIDKIKKDLEKLKAELGITDAEKEV